MNRAEWSLKVRVFARSTHTYRYTYSIRAHFWERERNDFGLGVWRICAQARRRGGEYTTRAKGVAGFTTKAVESDSRFARAKRLTRPSDRLLTLVPHLAQEEKSNQREEERERDPFNACFHDCARYSTNFGQEKSVMVNRLALLRHSFSRCKLSN